MGVSGCARECAEARGKDVGVIATEDGWNLYVGGNGGATPRARPAAGRGPRRRDPDPYIDRFLMYYIRTADRLQRTARWLEELDGGIEHVRDVVVDDALGIAADLEAAMATHVDTYVDEWAATLEGSRAAAPLPSRSSTPRTPPTRARFVPERGQVRPARHGTSGPP